MHGVATNGKPWTDQQMRDLREMRKLGYSWPEIAEKCEHTITACRAKVAVLGAVFIPVAPVAPATDHEIRLCDISDNRDAEACDLMLAALQAHHPARAGELVCTDKGFRVIGGAPDKPRFIKAKVRTVLPDSGNMCRPVPVHPTSSASCAQAW